MRCQDEPKLITVPLAALKLTRGSANPKSITNSFFGQNLSHRSPGDTSLPAVTMGGHPRTPQTTLSTPKLTLFSFAASNVGNKGECQPKINNQFFFCSKPISSVPGRYIPTSGDHGGHPRTPQTTLSTPKLTLFSFAASNLVKQRIAHSLAYLV